MPSQLPDGDVAPRDGTLPESALEGVGERPFGIYVHVPFCTVRCGYCDFNTYTAQELGDAPGASRATYAEAAIAELRLARRVLGERDVPVSTVFLGGGTPTLLPPGDLAAILRAVDAEFGLAPGAEVTTESNPDSVTADDLAALREAGFNRISFGMQSAVPHVLATLDRTHDPARVPSVVEWARAAGFEQVSLDLIYGTPGESLADWTTSVDSGARGAARPRVGVRPDRRGGHRARPTDQARRAADAGRRRPRRQVRRSPTSGSPPPAWTGTRSRTGPAMRPAGAGTTSSTGAATTGGVSDPGRTPTSAVCAGGTSSTLRRTPRGSRRAPALRTRARCSTARPGGWSGCCSRCACVEGLPGDVLDPAGAAAVHDLVTRGLLVPGAADAGWVVLTRRGRLLADAVVRDLLPD